jgi:DUF4097 and DUF4098 domain-containing protein YvlB
MNLFRRVSLAILVLACSLPLLAREEGTFDRTLKVSGAVDLDVQTGSGSISIRSGAGDTVTIHGTIRASEDWLGGGRSAADKIKAIQSNPPIEQTGNFIRVGHINDEELRRNISISYEITVPPDTKLRSRTGSGSQTVAGLRGPVDINTGSGSLRVSDISSEVRAGTGSGNIDLNNLGASVRAHAGSGSITASRLGTGTAVDTRAKYEGKDLPLAPAGAKASTFTETPGTSNAALELETGSGHIRADNVRGSLRAHTGSGGIEVDGQPTGDWSFRSGSGSVRVRVPSSAAFDLYAHTGSGGITVDHPLTMQGSLGRHEVRGQVRGGGFHLDIQTGSGGVHVE